MTNRICLIGSSYIGAVYTAYRNDPSAGERYAFDFYGHSNGGFPNTDIVGGQIRNMRFKSPAQPVDVGEYDAFVIYGDLPAPHDLAKKINVCVNAKASQQLMEALVTDIGRSTTSLRLADTLHAATGKPVLIMSGNVVIISRAKMGDARHAFLVSLFDKALAPHIYIPFPRAIFLENFLPNDEYYQGSIGLTGEKAQAETGHDNHHMNERGGLLILQTMMDRLDQMLPPAQD